MTEIAITREAILPGTLDTVFDFIVAEDVLPKILTGYGPLPAVIGTSEVSGPWDEPGSQRMVHLADGSTAREQVTLFARSTEFGYRVWAFSHPLIKRLSTGARGYWTFASVTTADGPATKIVWTYTYTATSALAAWPLRLITKTLWRGYMDRCLENSVRFLNGTQR